MSKMEVLSNYLSHLEVEIYDVNYNYCASDWRCINYTPNYSKFYFICDGEGWLKIGDVEYYPKQGQLFIMPEGVLQSYSNINSNPFLKYWCHFSAKVGDISLFKLIDCKHFITAPNKILCEEIFKEMNLYFSNKQINSNLLSKARLMELISYYIMNIGVENIDIGHTAKTDKLNNIIDYISNHLDSELSIQELAKIAYMHPNYFIRFFKENIGIPPIHYINQKRIIKAKELLLGTNSSITEISRLVGFKEFFYFSKLFKKNVGITPTEFRTFPRERNMLIERNAN